MPVCEIPETNARYYLVCFDENGIERLESDGSKLSHTVSELIANKEEPVTDVFFASHGWKGDVPAAIDQYNLWVGEMVRAKNSAAYVAVRPNFKSIVVGLHWPSLPFGDENIPTESGLLAGESEKDIELHIDKYASILGDTPKVRDEVRIILEASRLDDGQNESLPPEVREAYDRLYGEIFQEELYGNTLGAPPGADHREWDPDEIYNEVREAEAVETRGDESLLLDGGILKTIKGIIVAPLQQLSFWKMKDRARRIGETAGNKLLCDLQSIAPPDTRFHLMGHSFGCIVVSATVAGVPGNLQQVRPVHSLFLVQGAMSLWSFSPSIPYLPDESGYFNRILSNNLVRGPIVTTRSKYDTAVGKLYPPAARMGDHLVLAEEFPKYGGLGSFGAQGLGNFSEDLVMQPTTMEYGFKVGRVYNLEASEIIKNGSGFSGAHSDIDHPEIAHAMWEAVGSFDLLT